MPDFASTYDPGLAAEAKRRRAYAEQLMKAGQQPGQTEMVSGMAVAQSPIAGLARALQQGLGGFEAGRADALDQQAQQQQAQLLAGALQQKDARAAASMLAQDPALASSGVNLYGQALQADATAGKQAYDERRDDVKFEREATLKRELAAMNKGGWQYDPDTGGITPPVVQDTGANDPAKLAAAMGVPSSPLDTRGLSPKDASALQKQTRLAADKRLQDPDYTAAANKARANITDAERFADISKNNPTGGIVRNVLPDWLLGMRSDSGEQIAITNRLAPQQRVPGSGSSSDRDVALFKSGLPSIDKPNATNTNIITGIKARENDTLQYQSFLSDYLQANGNLNGADASWQKYVNDNPIFAHDATEKDYKLNSNRKSYKEYFSGTSKPAAAGWKIEKID